MLSTVARIKFEVVSNTEPRLGTLIEMLFAHASFEGLALLMEAYWNKVNSKFPLWPLLEPKAIL